MRYKQVLDGERVQPKRKAYKLMCCDCGLVHIMNFYVVKRGRGHTVQFAAWRDDRATAAARRRKRAR